jgi:hypothetical protein
MFLKVISVTLYVPVEANEEYLGSGLLLKLNVKCPDAPVTCVQLTCDKLVLSQHQLVVKRHS